MTLDRAIICHEELAKSCEHHAELVEWLKELKQRREHKAEWRYIPTMNAYKCSYCLHLQDGDANYCPECGAKMTVEEIDRNDYTKEGRLKIDG